MTVAAMLPCYYHDFLSYYPLIDFYYVEIKTYEDGGTRITVTTCEITREDDDLSPKSAVSVSTNYTSKNPSLAAKKNSSLGVKKKPSKRTLRNNKSKVKKGDKRRGAAKGKKNRGKK